MLSHPSHSTLCSSHLCPRTRVLRPLPPAPSASLPTLFPLALHPNLSPPCSQTRTDSAWHASRGYHRLPWRARDVTLVPRWRLRRKRDGGDPGGCAPGRVLGSGRSCSGRRGRACAQLNETHVYRRPHSPPHHLDRRQRRIRGEKRRCFR
jgi:hypothetical protein